MLFVVVWGILLLFVCFKGGNLRYNLLSAFFNDEIGKPERSLNLTRIYNALKLFSFSSFKEFKQKPHTGAQIT